MASYRFFPRNVDKYAGDPSRIVARSKWELEYMSRLDGSPMVRKWISEPKTFNIRYLNPLDKKLHEYWPDFFVQYIDGNMEVLEIKPLKQSSIQEASSTVDKLMLVKNAAKWQAANRFAVSIGAHFRIITERTLFRNKATKTANKSRPTRKPQGTKR